MVAALHAASVRAWAGQGRWCGWSPGGLTCVRDQEAAEGAAGVELVAVPEPGVVAAEEVCELGEGVQGRHGGRQWSLQPPHPVHSGPAPTLLLAWVLCRYCVDTVQILCR